MVIVEEVIVEIIIGVVVQGGGREGAIAKVVVLPVVWVILTIFLLNTYL